VHDGGRAVPITRLKTGIRLVMVAGRPYTLQRQGSSC
jgi:hypothetical protein